MGRWAKRWMPPETRLARPLVSMLTREMLTLEEPPASSTTNTPMTAKTPTAPNVHFKLQRKAASTASPASKATKLDWEKVGTKPIQRTAMNPVSSASVFRSRAHSSADMATTATSDRYLP